MNFEISYTDKEITSWGGMVLLKQMLERMNFDSISIIVLIYLNFVSAIAAAVKNGTVLQY